MTEVQDDVNDRVRCRGASKRGRAPGSHHPTTLPLPLPSSAQMRGILVDWLVDVALSLDSNSITLHLAVRVAVHSHPPPLPPAPSP